MILFSAKQKRTIIVWQNSFWSHGYHNHKFQGYRNRYNLIDRWNDYNFCKINKGHTWTAVSLGPIFKTQYARHYNPLLL